jgi:heme A synthase
MGNLLGGFVMLALCWRLVASARPPSDAACAHLGTWAVAGLALLCGQLAGGALVSASYAALACSDLADCTRLAAAAGWDVQALNPWREPVFEATALPLHAGGAIAIDAGRAFAINAGSAFAINAGSAFALWAHRVGAIVVLPVLALLGIAAWRRGRRRGGAALIVLAAVQGVLGLLIVATGLPLAAVLLRNLVAALLLATLVRLV